MGLPVNLISEWAIFKFPGRFFAAKEHKMWAIGWVFDDKMNGEELLNRQISTPAWSLASGDKVHESCLLNCSVPTALQPLLRASTEP
jgi:hypothetical protein